MKKADKLLVVLGNQLFPRRELPGPDEVRVFLCEDVGLCTYERHHQQKIVLFLSAMRSYADELESAGYAVHYYRLDTRSKKSYEDRLKETLTDLKLDAFTHFEIEDKPMEDRLIAFAREKKLQREELTSPMFMSTRDDFRQFAADKKRLLMADFYKLQRRRFSIMVDEDGNPDGGRWSFDDENRKKLPKKITPPEIDASKHSEHTADVIDIVRKSFVDHPGDAREFWWPTTRREALSWVREFLDSRFELFGPYEDAMSTRSTTVFHSVLSPLINLGLITPAEVIKRAVDHAEEHDIPISSLEGFVRQLTGWREFVRGVYREFGDEQTAANFWSHKRQLGDAWYDGSTGIAPLDDTIKTALQLGWTHHIPRLMVVGNLMTLCEIEPSAAHRWFMEMYVDSSEWVMGPNVYGMGIFSDGGIFATKPYICGSNYLRKMSDYPKDDWCDTVDGLYWRFIDKHRDFFNDNPRLALMPRALDRIDDKRRKHIFSAAEKFIKAHTK
ncbi:MAG: cryptochrome/photolyase family protein [Gammaproteobacteria bacterium]|nr:cryptochrome/photolyase family protein [Gammaproteobacteria bacterium]